jgi:membrane fusion protein (multidrug efflux system)
MNAKRMMIMLAGSAILFGGILGFVQFREMMIKQYFATLPKPVISVTAETARTESWQDAVAAVGTLAAVNGVDISAQAAGLIREISFQSGQTVRKGQMLLRLDAEVEASDLRSAQADADLARISADRQRALVKTDSVSKAALDKAEAELKVKEAKVAGIRAQIDKKGVTAPFDGVLGVRKIDLGQYLQPGQAIVNLQNLSVMLADFTVSQRDLSVIAPGQPVRMTTDAWPGVVFDGTIAAIEPQVDAKSGMILVQARFPNVEGRLRPGMFARIDIVRAQSAEVVTVPASAISYNLHGDAIFVVQDGPEGKQAARMVVELGERRDGRVVIRKGINPGDLVVTSGQLKLEHGSKVQMDETDPLKQAAKAG